MKVFLLYCGDPDFPENPEYFPEYLVGIYSTEEKAEFSMENLSNKNVNCEYWIESHFVEN